MATGEHNEYIPEGKTGILWVEPQKYNPVPVIDSLTRKMTAAYRKSKPSEHRYRGFHCCSCGVGSDNTEHLFGDFITNSLCVHYLAFHREDIPPEEIKKVEALSHGEEEPNEWELMESKRNKRKQEQNFRGSVDKALNKALSEKPDVLVVTYGASKEETDRIVKTYDPTGKAKVVRLEEELGENDDQAQSLP